MDCNVDCLKWDKTSKWEANGNFISNHKDLNSTIEAFGCACSKNNELLKLQQDIDEDEMEWFTPFYTHEKKIEHFVTSEERENNWNNTAPKMVMENIINMGFGIHIFYICYLYS